MIGVVEVINKLVGSFSTYDEDLLAELQLPVGQLIMRGLGFEEEVQAQEGESMLQGSRIIPSPFKWLTLTSSYLFPVEMSRYKTQLKQFDRTLELSGFSVAQKDEELRMALDTVEMGERKLLELETTIKKEVITFVSLISIMDQNYNM